MNHKKKTSVLLFIAKLECFGKSIQNYVIHVLFVADVVHILFSGMVSN
jgi:hypothetical protein